MNMGERFAMPVYPAAMSTLALPTTGPARWHHTRHAASALAFASAALALIASFLPLYSTTLNITAFGNDDSDAIVATATSWGMEITGGPDRAIPTASAVPMNGYPLVVACFVLIAAAVVTWFAATPGAAKATHRAAAMSVSIGAAFLLGTVWTVALQSIATIDSVAQLSEPGDGFEVVATYEVGHWLLLVAALIGIAAAVLALIPARDRTWAPAPVDPNMATPPYGFALPPNETPHSTVDPLTGLPTQIDPRTGQPVAPYTQSPPTGFQPSPPPVDPNTGLPLTGPPSGTFAAQPPADPNTGVPSGAFAAGPPSVDPNSGLSGGAFAVGRPSVDPNTGLPSGAFAAGPPSVDPNTGLPGGVFAVGQPPVDPNSGLPGGAFAVGRPSVDPNTGLPSGAFAVGQPPVDPNSGLPSGMPAAQHPGVQPAIDPHTGVPAAAQAAIDPNTGLPTAQQPQAPHTAPPVGVPALAQLTDPLTGLPHPTSSTPPDEPPRIDPATGMPVLGPIVIPDPPPASEQPSGPAIPPTEDPLAEPRRD